VSKILNTSPIFDESFENWQKQKIEKALEREVNAQAPPLRRRFKRGIGSLVNDSTCRQPMVSLPLYDSVTRARAEKRSGYLA
jgi:hypothetical protein